MEQLNVRVTLVELTGSPFNLWLRPVGFAPREHCHETSSRGDWCGI